MKKTSRKIMMASLTAVLSAAVISQPVFALELSNGCSGNEVAAMQELLSQLGYYGGEIDGDYGTYTENSVIQFQNDQGLIADGIAGPVTLGFIESLIGGSITASADTDDTDSPENNEAASDNTISESASGSESLSYGSQGNKVSELQEHLAQLGYYSGTIDGDYGYYTVNAVKNFQTAADLYADGIAGPITLAAISGQLSGNPSEAEDGTTDTNADKKDDSEEADVQSIDLGTGTLAYGSSGVYVQNLQKVLTLMGFYTAAVDGDYGTYTVNAVKAFQSSTGYLTSDGEAGPYTIDAIVSSFALYGGTSGNASGNAAQQDSTGLAYGKAYIITSGNLSVGVSNGSVEACANVASETSTESSSEKWILQDAGNGYYYLCNLKSWKCLDLINGNAVQNDITEAVSPLWKITENDDGSYIIENSNGTFLTASSGNVSASTDKTAWTMTETATGTAIDYSVDGTQNIGIRSYNVYHGLITQTTGYYDISTSIDLPSGGYYLSSGSNYSIGLKAIAVNNFLANYGYLSSAYYNYPRYMGDTAYAVMEFQSDYGLVADGIVGLQTWMAMGYSEYDYYNLGAYVTDLKVTVYGSSRDTYVDAMLQTAWEYASAGTGYKEGASGAPGTWVDCSGLIYQCLYSAGINPDTNIIDHARVVYEYTSAYLASDWQLGDSVSYLQPGDLVFYGYSSVNHVGIYTGNGLVCDSYPGLGVTYRSVYAPGNILKIVRVF